MKIDVKSNVEVDMDSLVSALSNPNDFAEFWFKFSAHKEEKELKPFAKAMAPDFGGSRKHCFRSLVRLIDYYEIKDRTQ